MVWKFDSEDSVSLVLVVGFDCWWRSAGSRIHLLRRWRLKEWDPGTLPWRISFVATRLVLVLGRDSE